MYRYLVTKDKEENEKRSDWGSCPSAFWMSWSIILESRGGWHTGHIFHCSPYGIPPTEELTHTFFNDEGAVLGLGGTLAQTHHVLRVDSEVVLVPHHQLGDSDAGAMVVLNTRVPLLSHREQISLNMLGITLSSTYTWIPYAYRGTFTVKISPSYWFHIISTKWCIQQTHTMVFLSAFWMV